MDNGRRRISALHIGLEFLMRLGADRAGCAVLEEQFFAGLTDILVQFIKGVQLLNRHR
ncbi:hypothetical protein D3C71_2119010 [compost metagenome]